MKAKVVYISKDKAKKINEIFEAEKEFIENENKNKRNNKDFSNILNR